MIRKLLGIALALTILLVACAPHPSDAVAPTSVATSTSLATVTPTSVATNTPSTSVVTSPPPATEIPTPSPCVLEPVVAPTRPAETPGYTQLDPDTGLHMTGRPQEIDLESYRLEVTGKVNRPLSLTLDDLRCLPKVETDAELRCPGFFVDRATWAGVPIQEILTLAGAHEGATELNLISADGYSTHVSVAGGLAETGLLAYEWEGEPLPILHGFPVRAVLPGINGSSWVKWLVAIEVKRPSGGTDREELAE